MPLKLNKKRIVWVLVIAFIQYLLAFCSWSLVPGNAVTGAGSDLARVIWAFTKFPLFYLFPRDLLHFDLLLIADAVIWGAALGWLIPAIFRKATNRR